MKKLSVEVFMILVCISNIMILSGLVMLSASLIYHKLYFAELGFISIIGGFMISSLLAKDIEKSNGEGE